MGHPFTKIQQAGLFAWVLVMFSVAVAAGLPEGPPPGVVVVKSPAPAKIRVASPSIVRLPEGAIFVSHDWSGRGGAMTSVYRSDDDGDTWRMTAELRGIMWATLFSHRDALWLIGTAGGPGDAVIRKSEDGGVSWTEAKDSGSGVLAAGAYHCGPVPVVFEKGRVWRAFERRGDPKRRRNFTALVFSAPEDSDLLSAENWKVSEGVDWTSDRLQVRTREWIEGNVVPDREGNLLNILRTNTHPAEGAPFEIGGGLKRFEIVAAMRVGEGGKALDFDPSEDFRSMPGAQSKFTIRRDPVSGDYFSIVSKITAPELNDYGWASSPHHQRNVMILLRSKDLEKWEEVRTLLSYRKGEALTKANPIGFQYADWVIDGADILAVVRTAWTAAENYHDADHITYHRLEDFRTARP